jgi:hypothetical protein
MPGRTVLAIFALTVADASATSRHFCVARQAAECRSGDQGAAAELLRMIEALEVAAMAAVPGRRCRRGLPHGAESLDGHVLRERRRRCEAEVIRGSVMWRFRSSDPNLFPSPPVLTGLSEEPHWICCLAKLSRGAASLMLFYRTNHYRWTVLREFSRLNLLPAD